MALLDFVRDHPGEPAPERLNQEGKTNLDLLEQEIVSGSGISWAICKSAPPWPRHITTPASHHSVFYSLLNQQSQNTEGKDLGPISPMQVNSSRRFSSPVSSKFISPTPVSDWSTIKPQSNLTEV